MLYFLLDAHYKNRRIKALVPGLYKTHHEITKKNGEKSNR
jgi:hypothetical protein